MKVIVLFFCSIMFSSLIQCQIDGLIVRGWDNSLRLNIDKTGIRAWNVKFISHGMFISGKVDFEVFDKSNPNAIVQLFVAIDREIVAILYNGMPGFNGKSGTQTIDFTFNKNKHGDRSCIYLVGTWSYGIGQGKRHYEVENGGWQCQIGEILLSSEKMIDLPEMIMFPAEETQYFTKYIFQLNPTAVNIVANDYYQAEHYVRKMIWAIVEERFQGIHDSVMIAIAGSIAKHAYELFNNAKNYRNQFLQMTINVDNSAVGLVQGLSQIANVLDSFLKTMEIQQFSKITGQLLFKAKKIL